MRGTPYMLLTLCPTGQAFTLRSSRKYEEYNEAPPGSIFYPKFSYREQRLLAEARENKTKLAQFTTKPDCSVKKCQARSVTEFFHYWLRTWDNCSSRDADKCNKNPMCKLREETACRKAVDHEFNGSCIASRNNEDLTKSDYKCGMANSRTECYLKTRKDRRYIYNSDDNAKEVFVYECGWVTHDIAECEHACDPIHGKEQYLDRANMTICTNVYENNVVVCKLNKSAGMSASVEPVSAVENVENIVVADG